jgi:hypothetical protein
MTLLSTVGSAQAVIANWLAVLNLISIPVGV